MRLLHDLTETDGRESYCLRSAEKNNGKKLRDEDWNE